MMEGKKAKRGRPPNPMPEKIPDTPENIANSLMSSPPKSKEDWAYLKNTASRMGSVKLPILRLSTYKIPSTKGQDPHP